MQRSSSRAAAHTNSPLPGTPTWRLSPTPNRQCCCLRKQQDSGSTAALCNTREHFAVHHAEPALQPVLLSGSSWSPPHSSAEYTPSQGAQLGQTSRPSAHNQDSSNHQGSLLSCSPGNHVICQPCSHLLHQHTQGDTLIQHTYIHSI